MIRRALCSRRQRRYSLERAHFAASGSPWGERSNGLPAWSRTNQTTRAISFPGLFFGQKCFLGINAGGYGISVSREYVRNIQGLLFGLLLARGLRAEIPSRAY
jgi:hypothetical protein